MLGAGGAAVAKSLELTSDAAPAPAVRKWPIEEGPDTPKLCLSPGDGGQPLPASLQPAPQGGRGPAGGPNTFGGFLDPKEEPAPAPPSADMPSGPGFGRGGNINAAYQRIRQLGVTHLLGVYAGGTGGVWTEESVRGAVDTAKAAGLVAYNAMINVPSSVLYGKETRAKDMEPFIASIEAAGKGGLPVILQP